MSTAARIGSGAPVASITSGGPSPPDHSLQASTTWLAVLPEQALGAGRGPELQAGSDSVDQQSRGASIARQQMTAWPIGPAPSITTRSPSATRARWMVRTPIEKGSASAATLGFASIAKTCGLGDAQLLLEAAVGVDPDQAEVVADVAAADRQG